MIHKIFKKPVIIKSSQAPVVNEIDNFDKEFKNALNEYNIELKNINSLYDLIVNKKGKQYNNYKGRFLTVTEIKNIVKSLNLDKTNIKICDLGFGLGKTIFLLAFTIEKILKIKVEVDGIEINTEYVELFNQYIKKIWDKYNIKVNIIEENIEKHDVKGYDIVYFYKPLVDDKKCETLYSKIEKKLDKNTIILKY